MEDEKAIRSAIAHYESVLKRNNKYSNEYAEPILRGLKLAEKKLKRHNRLVNWLKAESERL